MRSLRIAVLDEELPYPLTSGKRIRTFHLLSRLADRHRITILCHRHADAAETAVAMPVLQKLGIETIVVPRAVPQKSGPAFYARLAGNLLSTFPFSVSTHTSPELVEAVNRFSIDSPPDLWHCEWTPYAQVLRKALGPRLKRASWLVVAHNVESVIWKRYAQSECHPLKRWYVRRQWRKFEKFEKWAFAHATWTVAVSEADAEMIRTKMGGSEQTEVVDNGVDTDGFRPQRDVDRDPRQLLFLGSLDWRPNQDGVRLLLDSILPAVRAKDPKTTLTIVGRNPPGWMIQQAAALPGVRVVGNVPDVRPYLAACGMLVVPLRVGGGSRLKILEALATATPVVSTRVGAEGLNLIAGRHFTMAEDEHDFAKTVLKRLEDPDTGTDEAEEGRRCVVRDYDWNSLSLKLDEVWQVAAEQPSARPTAP